MEITCPPLRSSVDIGAVFEQHVDHIEVTFGDDHSGRSEIEMWIVKRLAQFGMSLQQGIEPGGDARMNQLLESFQGISVVGLLQLDRQPQFAPALHAIFACDDGLRVAERERECG